VRKVDRKVIELFTEAYLWVLDWTGVYVATVGMFFVAMDVGLTVVDRGRVWWTDAFYFVVMSLTWFAPSWRRQHARMLSTINAGVLTWRESPVRTVLVISGLVLLLDSALRMRSVALTASNVMMLSWFYVTCVTVRDREPREFKLGRVLRPLTGGAS